MAQTQICHTQIFTSIKYLGLRRSEGDIYEYNAMYIFYSVFMFLFFPIQMISLLPSKIMKLLEFVGFSGKKVSLVVVCVYMLLCILCVYCGNVLDGILSMSMNCTYTIYIITGRTFPIY